MHAAESDLDLVGLLDFRFSASPELNHLGYIYFIRTYHGAVRETEEMLPQWYDLRTLPYEQMWQGDKTWIPMILTGKKIQGRITFAADNDTVQDIDIAYVHALSDDVTA